MATPTQTPANTTQAPANSSQVPANNSQHLSTSPEVSSSQSSNHEKNLMELPVSPDSRFSISRHVPVVVSLNSTDGLSQRLQVLERREQVSTQQKRRKHVNAVDKVISTSSPVRNSSNHMLRYIASLTPDEARAYAKREIENAPLVTDDHDLYTPLFRNVSMFKRKQSCLLVVPTTRILRMMKSALPMGCGPIIERTLQKLFVLREYLQSRPVLLELQEQMLIVLVFSEGHTECRIQIVHSYACATGRCTDSEVRGYWVCISYF
ncbi:uncharacterized protein LOC107851051 isoform X2 [Capsicum annuum]|uniref:uncharacterized protein LOC107851051 isoform X2 n=1 Tax=Capsicum annuum TaxID=4072 RepID=UPI0007BF914B|nr:uncharacterized protein LOC107851051 isoform X2 [Capsicum annuum]